jgi:hypothetical protein
MLILRAGLVGCLAAYMLPRATLVDDRVAIQSHMALMRFRSNKISEVTGIPFKKVKVYKSIFDIAKNDFSGWTPRLANLYSKKVSGGIFNRSINNLDTVERWTSPPDFHHIMLDELENRFERMDMESAIKKAGAAEIISTLPIAEICKIVEMPFNPPCAPLYSDICVTTVVIENCDVNHTIYYPDATSLYRATLQSNSLIIESIHPINQQTVNLVISTFGIDSNDAKIALFNATQQYGKMGVSNPTFERKRLQTILELTERFGIYSLGRTATVRNILMDDCYEDIRKIDYMIKTPKYQRNLGLK